MSSTPNVIWDDQPHPAPTPHPAVATSPQVQWDDEVSTPHTPPIPPPANTPQQPVKPAPVQITQPSPAIPPAIAEQVRTALPNIAQYPENQQKPDPDYVQRKAAFEAVQGEPGAPQDFEYDAEQERRIKAQEQVDSAHSMVPQAAVPALAAAKKYAVDPFERASQAGAQVGRDLATRALVTPPVEIPMQDNLPPVTEQEVQERLKGVPAPVVGTARAAGSVVGGVVADPRMWPLFFAGPEASAAKTAMSAGFATQMAVGAYEQAGELGKIMDNPDVPQEDKWEAGANMVLSTLMAAQAGGHPAMEAVKARLKEFQNLPPADQEQIRNILRKKAPEIATEVDKSAAITGANVGPLPDRFKPIMLDSGESAPKVTWDDQKTTQPERFRLPLGTSAAEVQGEVKGPNIRTVQVGDKTYAFDQRKINADGVKSAVERNELWRLTGGKAPEAAKVQAEQDVRGEEAQPATEQPVKEQAAPEVKWDDEAGKPEPQAAAPQTKVQVPVMITRQMESDLRARGVSQQDIDRMTPEQAHTKLQEQKVSESPQTAESATKPIEEKVSSKPEVSEESAQTERRTNTAERKRVAEMTPEERSHELLTSPKTGLPNDRAFEEDAHTLAESHPHVGYADLDDFKRYNDALGHEGVDKAVLPAIGDLFRDSAAKEPLDSVKVYHRSGDEFNFRATTPEAIKRVTDRVNKELAETTFRYQTKDGRILEKKGTGLSHGIGTDHESAEENSHADKQRRKELGLREGGRDVSAVDTRGAAGEQTAVRENTERERVPGKPAEEVKPSQTISGHLNGRRSSKIGTLTLPDKTVLELSVRPDPSQMGVYSLAASNGKNSTSYRMQYKGRDTLADVKKSFEEYLNIDSPGHEVTIGAPKQPHEMTLPEFAKNQGKPAENRYVQQQHEAVKKKAAPSRAKLSADKLSDFQVGRDKVVREGDRTYVVDRSGSHARTEVLSDAITPEFKTNVEKLTPEQRQRMIETVKTTPYLSDEGRKERLEVLQGQGEVKPAEAARADTSAEKKRIHDEIQALNKERNSLGFKIDADRFNPSPETKTLVERHTELGRKMRALDDEVAKLDGQPTSSEKREIAKNEAEKKFAERPTGAMKYGDAAQSQPWQVSEKDFIARRFESEAKRYEKAVAEQEKKVADLRPGSTKRISEESSLHFWNERLAKLKAGDDPRITQEFRNAYIKHVKEAISHGRPVPQEVIDQHPEFVKAQDARERYEKGKHTSFSNRSVAINDTMQKELGFKVKRQDGKPITDEQIKEIHQSVKDVESVIGPMADIMRGVDLTVVHTNGKFPFLMNDAAGLFSETDRRITVGLQSMFSPRSIPVFAHEIGHMIDIKGGNLLGESARLYTKGGKGYTTTALSEADAKKFKGDLISQATEAINNVRKVRELLRAKKTEDLTPEEKQEIEGAKVKLGPYWREPREVFARLFEQYIANRLGKRSEAAQSPESYAEQPGYWTQQQFEKFIPKIEAEINRRLDALHAKYGAPGSEAPKAGKTEAATASEPVPKAKQEASATAQLDEAVKQTGAEVKEGKPSPEFAAKIADATHLEPANHADLKEKFTGAAYQREYFKAALEQAKDAWIAGKESKVPGEGGEVWEFLAKDSSYAKETDRPADYESDQLYVKVPEDGHFLVNNTPFAIEKALKGATRGFAAPRASFNPEAKAKKFFAPKATPEAVEKYRKELAEELSSAEGDKSYAESRLKDDKESREKHAQLTDDLNKELKALRAKPNGEQEKVVRQEYQDKMRRLPRQMSDDEIQTAKDTIAQREADIPVLHQNVKDFEEQFPSNGKPSESSAPITDPNRVVPGARSAATGNETGRSEMEQLTASIKQNTPSKSLSDRLKTGERLGAKTGTDPVTTTIGKLKGTLAAVKDALARPPKWGDYEDATGKWSGADQRSALELDRFSREIKKAVPDKLKREAISNWIEAGGDDTVLQERAYKSGDKFKPGYEAALKLTDAEKTIARNVMGLHDATLQEAIKAGILDAGIENYIQHVYKDKPEMVNRIRAEMNFNSLKTNPSFAKKRVLPTYFDAEQLGFTPQDKDVGFLTAMHERSLREALAARGYVKSLTEGKAADGRPLVSASWASAKEIGEAGDEAYMVKPNLKPGEDYADYKTLDHPALRGWKWAGEVDGKPVFVKGDVQVHPEIYQKLKNNLSVSALRRYAVTIGDKTIRPGAIALNTAAQIKQFVLSFSGFHQTTLAVHALEHKVLPAGMPELDLSEPVQSKLVDHGLMVAHYDAMDAFGEGVSSGGAVTKIPGIGPLYKTYIDYLFKSYMPRLKMQMAKTALERNRSRYPELNDNQLYSLTASQANAAFGGLNYRMLGRNKTFQDTLRLALMAPDFTEARGRFVGQAAKPYGREQAVALVLGALALYTAARAINQMSDDKPHWDKPFSVVHNGKEYHLRTVQGDVLDAAEDPMKFLRNRVSPPVSMVFKEDKFQKKHEPLTRQIENRAQGMAPIPIQPWLRKSHDTNAQKATESILKMIGVNETQAPKHAHR